MRADVLADLIGAQQQAPQVSAELGHHTGIVLTWDELTGANTVEVQGSTFTNLKVLTTGAGIVLSPGDVVSLLRVQTVYYILGRVAAPGAGAALGIRVASALPQVVGPGSPGPWSALAGGPVVPNVYISSAKRCLVIVSNVTYAGGESGGAMSFSVSGASSIAPDEYRGTWLNNLNPSEHQATVSQVFLLTAADGLAEGLNTFTAQYKRIQGSNGLVFDTRYLIVWPF